MKYKMKVRQIFIASDHAGYKLKENIKKVLIKKNKKVLDLVTNNSNSVDYPEFGHRLSEKIGKKRNNIGILICGSGIGMSISANRFKNVRAGLAFSSEIAKLMREHNDANVLVLPGRFMDVHEAKKCVDNFVSMSFEGGRHSRRLKKIKCYQIKK